jgi:hypothetical protein
MKILIKRIRGLSYPSKWLLLKGLSLACFIRLSLKITNFKKTLAILSRFEGNGRAVQNGGNHNDVAQYHTLIILASGFTPFINCLSVSIAYWWLMKRKGIITHLKFGMRTENEKLLAHAWLEYEGEALTEKMEVDEKYISFKESIL